MKGTFLFLGTGASAGIPVIGCSCSVCSSLSPCNQRLRCSGLICMEGKTFLIDSGPDFRQQALHYGICSLDGLLLTHTHYDHIAGIDELRIFYFYNKKALPCLLSEESLENLKQRCSYLFQPIGHATTVSAQLEFQLLSDEIGEVEFQGFKWDYVSYFQGDMKVTGYRIGNFAYISDIREYGEEIFYALKGVEKVVISALRMEPSRLHFSLYEAVDFVKKVGASKGWITHIAHGLDHATSEQLLPPNIRMGYDGLEIEFEY